MCILLHQPATSNTFSLAVRVRVPMSVIDAPIYARVCLRSTTPPRKSRVNPRISIAHRNDRFVFLCAATHSECIRRAGLTRCERASCSGAGCWVYGTKPFHQIQPLQMIYGQVCRTLRASEDDALFIVAIYIATSLRLISGAHAFGGYCADSTAVAHAVALCTLFCAQLCRS